MLNRREFASLLPLGAAALAVTPAPTPRASTKPKALAAGDTVGLVLPATAASAQDEIAFAKEQMEAIGFKVVLGKHVYDRWGYFAGRDRDRADDINAFFADDAIAGIVCYTGGWGSPRVLPYLDYQLITRKPKVLMGYSDITALLNAIHRMTGLVTFHGPVGGSTFEPYTLENFKRVVMTASPAGLLTPPSKKPNELIDRTNRIVKLAPGKARGALVGGNLTMVASVTGSIYAPDTAGRILFLEDTHEEPYRIDRMLTELALAGAFKNIAGFMWGRCTDCEPKGNSFSLEEILRDRFASLGVPALSGLSFGHIEQKLTLPIGVMATIDGDAGTVSIDEAAVV
ncbi:MAG TPA: LD-carboxypeptidase [Thermoanaerobaculia bacterium]|nr:LD-carboxypeptidase [Thermoanaerobaculia bacterium]